MFLTTQVYLLLSKILLLVIIHGLKLPANTSHNKTIRHTYNILMWLTIYAFLAAHVRDKDCTNYQHTPLCSEV